MKHLGLFLRGFILTLIWTLCGPGSWASAQEDPAPHAVHGAESAVLPDDVFEESPEVAMRRQESFAAWMIRSCGIWGILSTGTGFLGFLLALLIVFRGEGPFAAAALILIVLAPALIGCCGFLAGMIQSFQVIATSTTSPKPYEIADGIATGLFSPLLGFLMMVPGFAAASLGSLYRSMSVPRPEQSR